MRKPLFLVSVLALLILLTTSAVLADETDIDSYYPWRGHETPYDFYFGNMIDTHQQTFQLKKNGLQGFIYIHYTGGIQDEIPVAEKADCAAYPDECVVGWVIKGIPATATLVNKGPRIWLIDSNDLPKEPGYTHFHWTGKPGKPHGLVIGEEYSGYLLKRVAATAFYWLGGNGQGGSGGEGETGGCGGGCSGEDHTGEEGGCSGGGEDMGGGEMGGGCSGEDDHTGEEGGCSGGGDDKGGGNPGHGGRLVVEGLDSHSNIITSPDEPWHGGGCDD